MCFYIKLCFNTKFVSFQNTFTSILIYDSSEFLVNVSAFFYIFFYIHFHRPPIQHYTLWSPASEISPGNKKIKWKILQLLYLYYSNIYCTEKRFRSPKLNNIWPTQTKHSSSMMMCLLKLQPTVSTRANSGVLVLWKGVTFINVL